MGTPLLVVNGETVIDGFDRVKLEEALALVESEQQRP